MIFVAVAVGLMLAAMLTGAWTLLEVRAAERWLDAGAIFYEDGHVKGASCPCAPREDVRARVFVHKPRRTKEAAP